MSIDLSQRKTAHLRAALSIFHKAKRGRGRKTRVELDGASQLIRAELRRRGAAKS